MLLGADRRSAAEFSFWLAMPTMVGAFALELYKSRAEMTSGSALVIAVGFAAPIKNGVNEQQLRDDEEYAGNRQNQGEHGTGGSYRRQRRETAHISLVSYASLPNLF